MLRGIYGQEQLYHAQKRKAMEDSKEESKVEYPDSSINNHHTIPRQNFNSGDGSSQEKMVRVMKVEMGNNTWP